MPKLFKIGIYTSNPKVPTFWTDFVAGTDDDAITYAKGLVPAFAGVSWFKSVVVYVNTNDHDVFVARLYAGPTPVVVSPT